MTKPRDTQATHAHPRLSDSPSELSAMRRLLARAAIGLKIVVLPPDDPRLSGTEAARLDGTFYFSRDITVAEAWAGLAQGLATLVSPGSLSHQRAGSNTSENAVEAAKRHIRHLNETLDSWQLAPFPRAMAARDAPPSLSSVQKQATRELHTSLSPDHRAALERTVLEWLFTTVKLNVKRQRVHFMLEDALQGEANCLGYAKLFHAIAPRFGLDCGIVDVVVDKGGRYVPHQANLFRFSDGTWQLADAWYGSTDIKHLRLGLRVKEKGRWRTRDVDAKDITPAVQIVGLRSPEVDGITFYILGNRRLARGETRQAVECYSAAIKLYPTDSRPWFNRAIAWEQLGEQEKARADYAVALRDDSSLIRLQATEHDEVTNLIGLDTEGRSQLDQAIYLLHEGFVTGQALSEAAIATRLGLAVAQVRGALARVGRPLPDSGRFVRDS